MQKIFHVREGGPRAEGTSLDRPFYQQKTMGCFETHQEQKWRDEERKCRAWGILCVHYPNKLPHQREKMEKTLNPTWITWLSKSFGLEPTSHLPTQSFLCSSSHFPSTCHLAPFPFRFAVPLLP